MNVMSKMRMLGLVAGLCGVLAGHAAPPPGAATSGLMEGFPPPADRQITRANHMVPPNNRWSFQHIRELWPTRELWRGDGPVSALASAPVDLTGFTATVSAGRRIGLEEFLKETDTDSFVVLHRGRVVYERYLNGQQAHTQHIMWSGTKSFVGTVLLMLAEEGRVDTARTVASYLPELQDSAFGDATVQQVLDMTTALTYTEIYQDPNADIWTYAALWQVPKPNGPQTIYEYLPTVKKQGTHGKGFHYVTPNTDVLGWIIRRVTGKSVDRNIAERILQPLGVERGGYIWLDAQGTEFAGGGLNLTARDAARFGQMILQGGRYDGRQVLPEAVAKRILQSGNRDTLMGYYGQFPGTDWYAGVTWAYHDHWWTFNNANKAVSAIGVHGQYIYLDARAGMVIVKQSSMPRAEGTQAQETDLPLMFQAIADHLVALPVR